MVARRKIKSMKEFGWLLNTAITNIAPKGLATGVKYIVEEVIERQAKENVKIGNDTTELYNSITTKVSEDAEGNVNVNVGTPLVWGLAREFWTGIYAADNPFPDHYGRQDMWKWQIKTDKWANAMGRNIGDWVYTRGQATPRGRDQFGNQPWLRPAMEDGLPRLKAHITEHWLRQIEHGLEESNYIGEKDYRSFKK
jgi:hypothetical protein